MGPVYFRKLIEITVRFSTLAKGPVNLITNSFCPLSRIKQPRLQAVNPPAKATIHGKSMRLCIKQPRLQTVNSPANGIIHDKSMRPHKTTILLLNILGGVENIMNFYEFS